MSNSLRSPLLPARLLCLWDFPAPSLRFSSVLAWRIPGTGEPGGLLSMGSHRVGHDWSDLAAVAAAGIFEDIQGICIASHFLWDSQNQAEMSQRKSFPSLWSQVSLRAWRLHISRFQAQWSYASPWLATVYMIPNVRGGNTWPSPQQRVRHAFNSFPHWKETLNDAGQEVCKLICC